MTVTIVDVKHLCKRLTVVPGEDRLSIQANENATILMKVLIRSTFCSKRVIEEFRLTNESFDWLIGEIETKFQHAQVNSAMKLPNILHGPMHYKIGVSLCPP